MRKTSSHHMYAVSFLRNAETGFLLPSCNEVDFMRLAECLVRGTVSEDVDSDSETEQADNSGSRTKGKGKATGKRRGRFGSSTRSAALKNSERPVKRVKLDNPVESDCDEAAVPVYCHTFEIDFSAIHEDPPETSATVSPDRDFLNVLARKCAEQNQDQAGPVVFELGVIYPHAYLKDVFACTADPVKSKRKVPLPSTSVLTLPSLPCDVKDADHDFHTRALKDILASAYNMQMNSRARISGQLRVIVAPHALIDGKTRALPITLLIEVTISLRQPGIFKPISTFRRNDSLEEEAQRRVLTHIFVPGPETPANYSGVTDMRFFLSCLHPAPEQPSVEADEAAQPESLLPKLLPFQRRSVAWLLTREGKRISASGSIDSMDISLALKLPLFWEGVVLADGKKWYMNRVTGQLLPDVPPTDGSLGGILAEEPGLGKTLESIALILLNPSINRNPSVSRWDPVGVIDVKEVKTTLIVTPASLAQQWVDEFALHAPKLKVLVYEGWTKVPVPITEREAEEKTWRHFRAKRRPAMERQLDKYLDDDDDAGEFELTGEEKEELRKAGAQMTWCDFVQQYDVCISTYTTLQYDLGVARAPLQRPRREVAKYVDIYRDRSPLVMVEWTRVIMDEVQMVGGGKTEEMVALIPRLSSFAVSGTPARARVDDLIHVINFLRIGAVVNSKIWLRLQKPAFAAHFKDLFERISVRTIKAKVQDELTIPQQSRYVVPIELGKIERHVYDQNLEQTLMDLGLDERGVAASSGWQVDDNVLRTWMRKLRGICTHPLVGQLAKQNDRLGKAGATLKSIGEVLENMKDQNWRALADDKKSRIQTFVRRAQLTRHSDGNPQRHHVMLEILLDARSDMDALCTEISEVVAVHEAKGEVLKQEAMIAAQHQSEGTDDNVTSPSMAEGKQLQRENSEPLLEDLADDGLPKTPAAEEHRHKKRTLQARLRECHIVLHQIHFLLGDSYNALGEAHREDEDRAYATAEELRKQLLKYTERAANLSITHLRHSSAKQTITGGVMKIAHCDKGGEESEDLLREADRIIDILNNQTELLFQWRARIVKLLSESLSASEGENADGEEYTRTLETQGEAETYLQAYAALLADRREMLVAERTALAAHDVRERKIRHTVAAQKAQQAAAETEAKGMLGGDELQPEHEVLQDELATIRKRIQKKHDGRAIKSVSADLQGVAGSIKDDDDPERICAKKWNIRLKALIKAQTAFHEKLESDMTQFRKAFNDRIQYFRQLQELSDTVRDVEWEGSLDEAIAETHTEEDTISKSLNKHRARQRYLENLAGNDEEDEEDNYCILCKSEFTRGFITQCAHVYCEGCLKAWLTRKEGKVCPVCRVIIDPDQLQRITMSGKKIETPPEPSDSQKPSDEKEVIPRSKRVIEYNVIDKEAFEEIQKVDCLGSYGSKIETLVRHLLYLEDVDPGCKSIVFSAWADSLYILERAMKENGITCLRIDQTKGKQNAAKLFKTDNRIRVLLLHGERQNAGLNVTCASRVFLTESVVQHSFELQAIARIDRMGQTRPTEVYCYYAENTVEKNILDLASKRGLSLYTKDHAVGTLKVTSFDMDKNGRTVSPMNNNKKKGQKGDFIYNANDMLEILFPHLFEDIEYLVPRDGDIDMLDIQNDLHSNLHGSNEGPGTPRSNDEERSEPVAGPSRLM
ncbi:hypothetical protein M0805_007544 [Coniferiporia weirii]|nr:hypothetical protein M0805_007544 [Coniferiporia weirii]